MAPSSLFKRLIYASIKDSDVRLNEGKERLVSLRFLCRFVILIDFLLLGIYYVFTFFISFFLYIFNLPRQQQQQLFSSTERLLSIPHICCCYILLLLKNVSMGSWSSRDGIYGVKSFCTIAFIFNPVIFS